MMKELAAEVASRRSQREAQTHIVQDDEGETVEPVASGDSRGSENIDGATRRGDSSNINLGTHTSVTMETQILPKKSKS